MTKYLQILIAILAFSSCEQWTKKENNLDLNQIQLDSNIQQEEYSTEFIDYFQKNNMTLKGNSIKISNDNGKEIIQIPEYIEKNSKVVFTSRNEQTITIRYINYTDIEFKISYSDEQIEGQATLLPHFYLGTETVEYSDGEYLITKYFVTTSSNPCIDYIGLGNQNITYDEPEELYAMVALSGGGCENELEGLTNQKLKKMLAPISASQTGETELYQELQRTEKKLKTVYENLEKVLADIDKKSLAKSQNDWLKFRDSNCNFKSQKESVGGVIANKFYIDCKIQTTEIRINELTDLINGF